MNQRAFFRLIKGKFSFWNAREGVSMQHGRLGAIDEEYLLMLGCGWDGERVREARIGRLMSTCLSRACY